MRYAEIRTDYIEDGKFCYIDTWMTGDDNEEGHSVAKVNLHNGDIVWLDRTAIGNPQIALTIVEIIRLYKINIFAL